MNHYTECEECAYEGEYEVDAEYICADCETDICFDHMKEWPQPKWVKTEVTRYCRQCYQYRWEVMA